jgi:glycosyltransferase involved in cell wall biosynthesis
MNIKPFKIFDCSVRSVSKEADDVGPFINNIISYLHKYSEDYFIHFTCDCYDADVIITNDIISSSILDLDKPIIKIMGSPYCHQNNLYKNDDIFEATIAADKVIFISNYSRDQYIYFQGLNLKNHCVINCHIDPNMFFDIDSVPKWEKFTMAAIATDWSRKEKRLPDIIKFAELFPDIMIMLIGKVNCNVPTNVMKMGEITDPIDLSGCLNMAHGLIDLSYRNPVPKAVVQALSCGLPVLYANSGGTIEIVGDHGINIKDDISLDIVYDIPNLNINDMETSFILYQKEFDKLQKDLLAVDNKFKFTRMLDRYFEEIVDCVEPIIYEKM